MKDENPPSDGQNISNFLVGGLMLTLPYLFVFYLMKGEDPVNTYMWYIKVALHAGGVIGVLTVIALTVKKHFHMLFENPPKSPEWLGFASAGVALVVSIIGSFLDDWQTGLLLFWPSTILAVCGISGLHWLAYQVKRWRT